MILVAVAACQKMPEPPQQATPETPETPVTPVAPQSPPLKTPAAPPKPTSPTNPSDIEVKRGENGEVLLSNHPLDDYKVEEKNGTVTISNTGAAQPAQPPPSAPPVAPSAPPTTPTAPPKVAPPVSKEDAEAVAQYLEQLKSLEVGPQGVNPRAFADELVKAASKGDSSGMQKVIEDVEKMQQKLERMSVPEAAKAHHQTVQKVTAKSLKMLRALKRAVDEQDIPAIAGIGGDAKALQDQGLRLQALEKQLREKYGL